MKEKETIFIGSSEASMNKAQLIANIVRGENSTAIGWWQRSQLFTDGATLAEGLEKAKTKCTAALILVQPKADGSVSGNLLLEIGYFRGAFAPQRTAIATLGNTTLPSDLDGVLRTTLVDAENAETFVEDNRIKIRTWIESLPNQEHDLRLRDVYRRLQEGVGPDDRQKAADIATSLLEVTLRSLTEDNHYGLDDDLLARAQETHLRESVSVFAVDAVGPESWISASHYRYLAPQLQNYLLRNTVGDKWIIKFGHEVHEAIGRAIANLKSSGKFAESLTLFDNPDRLQWEVGKPKLEYSRILLWTKEELLNPIAESVISIHEYFRIPLFFLEVPTTDVRRKTGFILYCTASGDRAGVQGFAFDRDSSWRMTTVDDDRHGTIGSPRQYFFKFLGDPNLMFAKDARSLYRREMSSRRLMGR